MLRLKIFLMLLLSFSSILSFADLIKPGQTVTLIHNAYTFEYNPSWTTTNPTLKLNSSGFKCDVYCQSSFGGTATVTCSYKARVGTSVQDRTDVWNFTCNNSGGDNQGGGQGGGTTTKDITLETYNLSVPETEIGTIRARISHSPNGVNWSTVNTDIIRLENSNSIQTEVRGLKPGKATVVCYDDGGGYATCEVTVTKKSFK